MKSKSEWKKTTLGDLVTFQRGHDLPKNQRNPGKYPIVASNGIVDYHNEYKSKGPGVIIGRSGSLGSSYYVEQEYWPLNTTLYSKEFHNCNPKFLYYFIKTLHLESFNAGTAVPTLNRNHIHPLEIFVTTNYVEQKKIAKILSDLDNEIINIQNQNKILEQIIQSIFKSWFIDFDGHTEFMDSELGQIPKGWNISSIKELCQKSENGGTPRRDNSDYWKNGTISWFKTGELEDGPLFDSEEHITDLGLKESSCKLWAPGTILVAMYGATASKIGFLTTFSTSNQACNALLAKNDYGNMFLFFLLKYYQDTLSDYATGSAQPNLNKDIISNFQIILPPSLICKKFQNLSFPLFEKIIENSRFIYILSKIRDSLLPKLMSGELVN